MTFVDYEKKSINLNFIHFANLNKIQYNLVIWKKIHPFKKNKKLLLLLFKNQISWKVYIFKIVYIKNN